MLRLCLATLLFAVAGSALAVDSSPVAPSVCHRDESTVRAMWQHMYDVPPSVSGLMVDVIDDKLTLARQQLAGMSPAEAKRWRQTALLVATWAGHASLVDALLDDGAAVDGKAWIPPFKSRAYKSTVDAMKHGSLLGGSRGVKGLQSAGLVNNRGWHQGPALFVAAECGDAATLRVLLHHHAAVNQTTLPHHRGAGALVYALLTGDAPSVRVLLDHGADPCGEDRRRFARFKKRERLQAGHVTPPHTVASLGRRVGLPPALVKRLTCHQLASAG